MDGSLERFLPLSPQSVPDPWVSNLGQFHLLGSPVDPQEKTQSRNQEHLLKIHIKRTEGATLNPTEGPSLKHLQTINAEEGVEKREPSADAGVN